VQIIKNWLSGKQNFVVGTTLYKTFGTNEDLKKLLEKGETTFSKKQLVDELTKLVEGGKKVSVPITPMQKDTGEMPPGDDAVLIALRNEWVPLYAKMNLLRHRLDDKGNDNSPEAIAYRKPIAAEIRQLEKECNAIWEKRDYYLQNGKLPFVTEKKFQIPTDPLELGRLAETLKKNIRRNRKLMKDQPAEPRYAQLYESYKTKFKEVTGKDYKEVEQ
jgi:hypothetical protein